MAILLVELPPPPPTSYGVFTFDKGKREIIAYDGNLAEVYVPPHIRDNQVETINNYAFYNNEFLKSIIISDAVSSIGTVLGCSNVTSVKVLAKKPPTLAKDAFKGCSAGLKIYVPEGSVNAYKTADNWSTYNISAY